MSIVQVLASRTKIYIILEYITGGELFDKIVCFSMCCFWDLTLIWLYPFSCDTKMESERAALTSLLSLQAKRRRMSEVQARKYFQQLIDGIDFCHSKGVYHRDLKVIFFPFWNPSFFWYVLMSYLNIINTVSSRKIFS